VSNTTTGTYLFTPTSNPCATTASITVSVNQPGIISITPSGNLTVCEGTETNFSAPNGFTNYTWNSPEGNLNGQFITSTSQGNYLVSATDVNGCISTSTTATIAFFEAESILVVADGSLLICSGENVILTGDAGLSNYVWSNNFVGASITITQSGVYSLSATNENGCTIISSDFSVTATPSFSVSITPQGPIESCEGEVIQLIAQAGYSNYSWSNSVSNDTLLVQETGGYSVSAEDESGCVGVSGIVDVVINSIPNANFTYTQTFTTEYEVQFTNTSVGDNNYIWNFGGNNTSAEENPLFTFAFDNNWPVQLIASNDCGKDTFLLSVSVIKTGLIDQSGMNSIQVGPNPAHDMVHIFGNLNNSESIAIKLIDMTGNIVLKENIQAHGNFNKSIDTKEIATGFYLLLIESKSGTVTKKFIKQ